jgi:kynurenine formamidase
VSVLTSLVELFGPNPPSNWGKWGADDEVGGLNYLGAAEVVKAVAEVKSGQVFTLQVPMGRSESPGDPLWAPREGIKRQNVVDNDSFESGGVPDLPGGLRYVDDTATLWLQGSTQYDGLGHSWYGGKLWNGYDASTTVGEMQHASILPIAERGIVGRAVLVDMARYFGKDWLIDGETFSHNDLAAAAKSQGAEIRKRDIMCVRTGLLKAWYELNSPKTFFREHTDAGLTYSRELVRWFQEMEIPNLVSDTSSNEVINEPSSGAVLPLHAALQRDLGVTFTEITWLEDLADACAADGRYSFLYVAAPLKVVHGTGAPVNPIAIR